MESGSITELYGEFRTGKSQLALTMCVTSFMPSESGGGDAKAIFIDTEGTFRPQRLVPIAERFGLDADFVLDNVLHARIHTADQLDSQLSEVAGLLADAEGAGPFRVLVIDSIIAPYRQEYIGRGELAERQQRIGQVMLRLKRLSEEFNLCVLITNQVTADPGGGAFAVADAKKAVGGHIIAHMSDTRIMLRKGKGDQRIAKIIDSPCMPEAEATFQISHAGINDAGD